MPRTALAKIQSPGSFPTAGVLCTFTAYDAANMNDFSMTGDDLLLVRNVAVSAKTVTINSSADNMGRSRDITAQSVAAATTVVFGPFTNKAGWVQALNKLHFQAEDNNIQFCVIKLT